MFLIKKVIKLSVGAVNRFVCSELLHLAMH